jgi:hypothetical protein
VEIPKQLALANIAVRLQRQPHSQADSSNSSSSSCGCLVPLGGEVVLDVLALPPPAKHSKGWSVRQVCGALGAAHGHGTAMRQHTRPRTRARVLTHHNRCCR